MDHIETKFSLVSCCLKSEISRCSNAIRMISDNKGQLSIYRLVVKNFLNDSSMLLLRVCKTSILKWIEGVIINQTCHQNWKGTIFIMQKNVIKL